MRTTASILTTALFGTLLAVSAATPSTAKETRSHRNPDDRRVSGTIRCSDDFQRGFGGFSGTPGHPFMGPGFNGRFGDDWGGDNWRDDPFWMPDPYYAPYDGTGYVQPAPQPNGAVIDVAYHKQVQRCW